MVWKIKEICHCIADYIADYNADYNADYIANYNADYIADYNDIEICVGFYYDEYDFIFIDGLHSYEQVLKDCKNYYSKIKTGGIFSGHDYNTIEGVNRAVNEFAFSVGKTIKQTKNDVWYWIK